MHAHRTEKNDLLDEYTLIPDREGTLRTISDLHKGKDITQELYNIAQPLLSLSKEDCVNIVDEEYADIIMSQPEYTRADLRKDIADIIKDFRELSIENSSVLEDVKDLTILEQLIHYCSIFQTNEPTSYRAKLMPIICKFYNVEYKKVIINPINLEEQDL